MISFANAFSTLSIYNPLSKCSRCMAFPLNIVLSIILPNRSKIKTSEPTNCGGNSTKPEEGLGNGETFWFNSFDKSLFVRICS